MPRKIRQLKADLRAAGFMVETRRGKGSHAVWQHPQVTEAFVTLSGHDGDDAKRYQDDQVRKAIRMVQQRLG
jgi:predicted RNA binding protein YcfA (HicA-like mRNA interferase family)